MTDTVEVAIKIPKEDYDALKNGIFINTGTRSGKSILQRFISAITNGTPLPEHGRLIDQDVFF